MVSAVWTAAGQSASIASSFRSQRICVVMLDQASFSVDDIARWIETETIQLKAANIGFVNLGRSIGVDDLFKHDGSDFVRLSYGMMLGEVPTDLQLRRAVAELGHGVSKLEFLRRLSVDATARKTLKASHRYQLLWLRISRALRPASGRSAG